MALILEKKNVSRGLSGALYGAADKNRVNLTNYGVFGGKEAVHIPTRQQSKAFVIVYTRAGK